MQTRQDSRQSQVQKVGANLVRANALLQCTQAELLEIVDEEQRWNPALEPVDAACSSTVDCGRCPLGGKPNCTACLYQSDSAPEAHDAPGDDTPEPYDWAHLDEPWDLDGRSAGIEPAAVGDLDRVAFIPAPGTLAQELAWQMAAAPGKRIDDHVIQYVVDCVDDHGYLRMDRAEACAVLSISDDDLSRVILCLQSCDPTGIGARSLQECLMIQIDQWDQSHDTPADTVAARIIREHWELFAQHRHEQLARHLRVPLSRVEEAQRFIQEHLTPYPAAQYREHWRHRPDSLSEAIRPDVAIVRTRHGFAVEFPPSSHPSLQVNPYYRRLAERIRARARTSASDGRPSSPGNAAAGDEQVLESVGRAESLIANIRRRQWAIKRIAMALMEHQQGFLETGKRSFMRPLTRTQLADELGMHESTVSRALLHKYVRLPSEEVVPFECFFKGSSTGRDIIADLIAHEDRRRPLTDQAIADSLAARGMPTARRTVAKYREELRLPPSHLRRIR